MPISVHLAFIGWALLGLVLFYKLPPRKAVLTTAIGGSLFLPNAGYANLYLLHEKISIIGLGLLLFSVIFHAKLWSRLRLNLFDVPMIVWCLVCGFASATSNGTGSYDALSATVNATIIWGVPYLLGRLYFSSVEGLRELAIGLILGGLIYVPLCLWEVRMSPQLHRQLYGFFQHDFGQHMRYGGFRPIVFKQHALAVSLWMALATVQALWLWKSGALKFVWGLPMGWITLLLLGTTLLCKSMNGIAIILLGAAAYFLNKSLRTALPILFLLAAPPVYIYLRATGKFSGETLIAATEATTSYDRGYSIRFRVENENLLIQKALERKFLGWARWGRSRVYKYGRDVTVTDGLWIIVFGTNGLLGLISLNAMLGLPAIVLLRRCSPRHWIHPKIAPASALAVMVALYMIDNIFNDMYDASFLLAAGALIGLRKRSVVLALKPPLVPVALTRLRPALGASIATTEIPST